MISKLKAMDKNKKKFFMVVAVLIFIMIFFILVFVKSYHKAQQKYQDEITQLEEKVRDLSDQTATYVVATKEVNIDVINTEIKDIGELATVEYLYTNATKFSDSKQAFGVDIGFTTKSIIAKWDGCIKAGVDINEVRAELDEKNKQIIVYMPEAKILSHEIEEDSFETLDEKNGLFNAVNVDDVRLMDAEAKKEMEERALESGIITKAFQGAQRIISRLIYTDIVKELGYEVVFKVGE